MISVRSLFHSVFGGSISGKPAARRKAQAQVEQDEEQVFLVSIADLTPENRQMRIERRAFYGRMAERQAIMEVEQRAQDAWR